MQSRTSIITSIIIAKKPASLDINSDELAPVIDDILASKKELTAEYHAYNVGDELAMIQAADANTSADEQLANIILDTLCERLGEKI